MKALVYTDKETLIYKDEADAIPKEEETLIKVSAVGICGSDMHAYQDIAWVRAFLTIPMHGCCGVILGFCLSYYHFYKKNIFFFIGPIAAIIIHYLYNLGNFEIMVVISLIIIFFLSS